MSQHLYLAVTCKTPACKTVCLIRYVGIDSGQSAIELEAPGWFDYQCGRCTKIHRYTREEAYPMRTDSSPPPGFANGF